MNEKREENSGIRPNKSDTASKRGPHGQKTLKNDSSSTHNDGRECNVLESGGTTNIRTSIIGGVANTLNISNNKNIYEDRAKCKSPIPWPYLKNEMQIQLMTKPLMVLQGDLRNKISLASLLPAGNEKELEDLIDDYILYKLLNDIDVHFGETLPELGETEAYFIPRTFLPLNSRERGEKSITDLIRVMGGGQTFVISDEAGTGKSTILKSLAKEMKKMFPNRWIIFVNLRSYATVFEKHLDLKFNHSSDAVRFFVYDMYTKKNHENDFEGNLLKWCLEKNGGVVLLFDGFDEISPKYEDVVKGLLRRLKNSRVENLVVTTRPRLAKELEEKLEAFSYRMRPFNEEEKLKFIVKHWLRYTDCDDKPMMESKAKRLIGTFSSSIQDEECQFMEVPLQCGMLAEVYKDKLTSSEELRTISLYELYQRFIYMKFQEEENKYQSAPSASSTENNAIIKVVVDEFHWSSAIRYFLAEGIVKNLKFHPIRKSVEEYVVKKVQRVGIMTGTGEHPVFVHRTFAEFFVAEFLIETAAQFEGDHFWKTVKKLLPYILGSRVNFTKVVRQFVESGLKSGKIDDEKFRLIQSSILKEWRLEPESTFHSFDRFWKKETYEMRYETYRFLLKCFIVDGNMPIDFFPLIRQVAPIAEDLSPAVECSTDLEIFLQLVSSLSKSLQDILLSQLVHGERANNFEQVLRETLTAFPGLLVTSESLRAKWNTLEEFLQASETGDLKRLRNLLEEAGDDDTRFWLLNASIWKEFKPHKSAISKAIENNRETALNFLLDRGVPLNKQVEPYCSPPLFIAIHAGNLNILKILVKRGVDTKLKYLGDTPLEYASKYGKMEMVRFLLDIGCERRDSMALHHAIRNGSTDIVRLLLEQGFDVNQRDRQYNTLLHYAALSFNPSLDRSDDTFNVMGILLAYGADTEARDSQGRTALHSAAAFGNGEGVRSLLYSGANVNARDENGRTALHKAAVGYEQVVTILLEHGADIRVRDNWGQTPLHVTANEIAYQLIFPFLKHGADIEATDGNGRTPLHLAAGRGRTQSVAILLSNGANVGAKDSRHRTALHEAVSDCGDGATVKLLLERGADVGARDVYAKTPLDLAITKWDLEMPKLSFPAKIPGIQIERKNKLAEALLVFTREEISATVLSYLEQHKNDRKISGLATIIIGLLEHTYTDPGERNINVKSVTSHLY